MPYFHVGQKVLFEDEDMTTHRGLIVMSRPDNAGDESAFEPKFIWVVEREDNQQLYGLCINEKPRKILRFKVGDVVMPLPDPKHPNDKSVSRVPGIKVTVHTILEVMTENSSAGKPEYHDYRIAKISFANDDDLTYA